MQPEKRRFMRMMASVVAGFVLCGVGTAVMAGAPAPDSLAGVYAVSKGSPDGHHARVALTLKPDHTFQLEIVVGGNKRSVTRNKSGRWRSMYGKVLLERKPDQPIFTIESAGSWTDDARDAARNFAHDVAEHEAYGRCSFRKPLVRLEIEDLDEPIPDTKAEALAALDKAKQAAKAYEKASVEAVENPSGRAHYNAWSANKKAHRTWLLAKAGFQQLGLEVPDKPVVQLPSKCRMQVQPIPSDSRIAIKFVSERELNDLMFPVPLKTKLVFADHEPVKMAERRVADGPNTTWRFSREDKTPTAPLQAIKVVRWGEGDVTIPVSQADAQATFFVVHYYPERRVHGFSHMLFTIDQNGNLKRADSDAVLIRQ